MAKTSEHSPLAGICGLFCGDCPYYLAPRIGDTKTLNRLAKARKISPGEIVCGGCLSDKVSGECRKCAHGFRECAAKHGVTRCFECPEFPCLRLTAFMHAHIVDGVSHHEKVIENLRNMRVMGLNAWIREKTAESKCVCGQPLYWYQKECPECGFRRY